MPARVEFCLLGPVVVRRGGVAVPIPQRRLRALLAVLLLHPGRAFSAARLAELLWAPGEPPSSAEATVRNYVKRLRHALGTADLDRIVTVPGGYLIRVEPGELDITVMEQALAAAHEAARQDDWQHADLHAGTALLLWRGAPLADIDLPELAAAEAVRLAELRLQAQELRAEADLRLGRHAEMVNELRQLAGASPHRERLHGLLMLALYRSGRRAEALAAYQSARSVLVSQLGSEPGPELQALHRQVLTDDPALAAPAPPPAGDRTGTHGQAGAPRQLPAAVAGFTGRDSELAALTKMLGGRPGAGTPAMVISAISGMAGVGKTTLALHWAHQVADQFPDGQLYVNLRGFGPAAPMPPADALRGFLEALHDPGKPLPADTGAQEALYRSLTAGRQLLIVLDNARDEQQIRPLLPGAASCLTLITSRNQLTGLVATNGAVPLNLDLFTEGEARELLSRRLGPDRLDAEPSAADQFVASCSGLPLALSIAAARAALAPGLPLTTLSAQLSEPGLDALSAPDPHADLRTVFSWSYQQLSPDTARLFRCLPLFPGPDVSATAAASVIPAAGIYDLLAELTSAHLLEEYVPDRFRLHDLLARYAQECSRREDSENARQQVLKRILTWYCGTAAAASNLRVPDRPLVRDIAQPDPKPAGLTTQTHALEWLETERRNLVAAVEVAAQHGIDSVAIALPLALRTLFQHRSYGHDWLHTHLIGIQAAHHSGDFDAEAYLHASVNLAYVGLGRAEEGLDGLLMGLALAESRGDPIRVARAHGSLCSLYFGMKRFPEAIAEGEQGVALAREAGDRLVEARLLVDLGLAYQRSARSADALTCYLSAQAIALSLEADEVNDGYMEGKLATVYLELGRVTEAIAEASAALEHSTRAGRPAVQAQAHHVLGDAFHATGCDADARPHWRAALAAYRELGDPRAELVAPRLASMEGN